MKIDREHFRGTVIGGAVADALAYGTKSGGLDLISDNTQMAAFTVDGLLWAIEKAKNKGAYAYIPCLFYAYHRWYYTQTGSVADKSYNFILKGDILRWEELYARRGEGMTSMRALEGSLHNKYGTIKNRVNNSKGCGGVMRVAPVGLCFCNDEKTAFKIGCESAALTHGHINGIVSAGYVAAMISLILQGYEVLEAAEKALKMMESMPGYQESGKSIKNAMKLAYSDIDALTATRELGEGFTSEELIGLIVYCVLKFNGDFKETVRFAANSEGNKISLATICGSILGAYHGAKSIPFKSIKNLELLELLIRGADKLLDEIIAGANTPRTKTRTTLKRAAAEDLVDEIISSAGIAADTTTAIRMPD